MISPKFAQIEARNIVLFLDSRHVVRLFVESVARDWEVGTSNIDRTVREHCSGDASKSVECSLTRDRS